MVQELTNMIEDEQQKPDIAFWFSEENDTLYLVRVREGLRHHQLLLAMFDLLTKALATDPDTLIMEYKK